MQRKKIMDMIRYPERLTYADVWTKDSEGLILLTNDGDLINAMMRGANRHEKENIVKTDRKITPDFLEKMAKGIYLKIWISLPENVRWKNQENLPSVSF